MTPVPTTALRPSCNASFREFTRGWGWGTGTPSKEIGLPPMQEALNVNASNPDPPLQSEKHASPSTRLCQGAFGCSVFAPAQQMEWFPSPTLAFWWLQILSYIGLFYFFFPFFLNIQLRPARFVLKILPYNGFIKCSETWGSFWCSILHTELWGCKVSER